MNENELIEELEKLGVSNKSYSLNGEFKVDAYIINKVYGKCEFYYIDEKGRKEDKRYFISKNEAYKYLLDKFKFESKYPGKLFSE